jgi:hypothetical protein
MDSLPKALGRELAAALGRPPRFIQYSEATGEVEYIGIDRIVTAKVKRPEMVGKGEPEDTEVTLLLHAPNGVFDKVLTGEAAFQVAVALEELGFIPADFREDDEPPRPRR